MQSLDLTVTVDRPMPDAQTQILGSVDSRMQSAGFTEHVMFAFEQRGPATEVRVTGKLRSRAHAEVTEALGGYLPHGQ